MVAPGPEEQEELRRRLYAPGATQADIEAYRSTEPIPPSDGPIAAGRSRSRVRRTPAIAGGAVALGAVVALVVAHPFARTTTAPAPTDSADVRISGALAVPEAARAAFLRAFADGQDPELLTYLDSHPGVLMTRLQNDGRPDSTEITGVGPLTVPLSPTSVLEQAGHITVALVADHDLRYEWRATRLAESNDRSGPAPAVAVHDGRLLAGAPVSGTVGYSGGVPTQLTLLVPTGTRWAVVVVYTD